MGQLNSLAYPAPPPSCSLDEIQLEADRSQQFQMVYAPLNDGKESEVPCVYYDHYTAVRKQWEKERSQRIREAAKSGGSQADLAGIKMEVPPDLDPDNQRLILHFHGNSEDVGHNLPFLSEVNETLRASVLAMEYPGYGFYQYAIQDRAQKDKKLTCNSRDLATNARAVYNNLVTPKPDGGLGYKEENIIVFGRSMGTGPASLIASEFNPRGLVLVSAYTTIKEVAQNVTAKWIGWVVAEHFNNRKSMLGIKCPVLMIHGEKDPLIPADHTRELFETLNKAQENALKSLNVLRIPPNMTHNKFNFAFDIMQPTSRFFNQVFNAYKP